MGPTVADLVAGIIDRIEDRPLGPGRPPMPTAEVVATLRFFLREGVQWRELWAVDRRASGSTVRRRLDKWHTTALLRRVHAVLVRMARSGPDAAAWDVVVDSCSVRAKRGGHHRDTVGGLRVRASEGLGSRLGDIGDALVNRPGRGTDQPTEDHQAHHVRPSRLQTPVQPHSPCSVSAAFTQSAEEPVSSRH